MNEMTWSCSAVLFGPRGDVIEVIPSSYNEKGIRIELLVMKWTASWKSMSLQET